MLNKINTYLPEKTYIPNFGFIEKTCATAEGVKYKISSLYYESEFIHKQMQKILSYKDLSKAIILATQLHERQKDKAGNPYIEHCFKVMLKVNSLEEKIIAILHDTIEDCNYDVYSIALEFNEQIAIAVNLLTKNPEDNYETYIDKLIASNNINALKVKQADLEVNMDLSAFSIITDKDLKRNEKYLKALKKIKYNLKSFQKKLTTQG